MSTSALPHRILTGMRPTGVLHLGHYVGALKQWLAYQGDYECFFLIADIQAMTTHSHQPELIERSVRDIVLDWIAIGLDPNLSNVHFVLQSGVRELPELYTLLSMATPFAWVEDNPTIKTELASLRKKGNEVTLGFVDYPVSQVADIVMVSYDPAENPRGKILVPVGEDQRPLLENSNQVARRFNKMYGTVFSLCDAKIGEFGRLPGIDGSEKMGKSAGNAINLSESDESLAQKVRKMANDPNHTRPDIPGDPTKSVAILYHRVFNPDQDEVAEIVERYETGRIGDAEVKDRLYTVLRSFIAPIRERRELAAKTADVGAILRSGTAVARGLAAQTLERARKAVHLDYPGIIS